MLVYIEYWLFFHILLLTWVFSFRFYDELLSISENFKFYVRRLSTDALFSSVFVLKFTSYAPLSLSFISISKMTVSVGVKLLAVNLISYVCITAYVNYFCSLASQHAGHTVSPREITNIDQREYHSAQKHRWFSGRILVCHAADPGSIRGRCIFRKQIHILFYCLSWKQLCLVPTNSASVVISKEID